MPVDGGPMTKRLYQCLRAVILDGSLGADTRLPPSRDLARELGIARNTVVAVYGQLQAEGYTHSQQGSGTFVLAGSNTFSGGTTVAGGTLVLQGGAALLDTAA